MVFPKKFADLALPIIRVKSCIGWEGEVICSPKDLLVLDESNFNPIVFLGECNTGKSALSFWLASEIVKKNPTHDVNLIDLPTAAGLWKTMKKTPTRLLQLVELYFGKNVVSFEEKSELFLDDHHQLSSKDHKILMSMLAESELLGEKFPFRVWLFARKNFEKRICTGGVREAIFELVGYSESDQKRIIFDQLEAVFGEGMDEHETEYRKDYVRVLYTELKKAFPEFDKSFGTFPVMLEAIAVGVLPHFEAFVKVYRERKKESEFASCGVNQQTTEEILERLPRVPKCNMVSHIITALVKTHVNKKKGLEKKHIKHASNFALLLIAEYAVDTFPMYEERELEMDSRKRDMICDTGFVVCDDQGKLKFHDMIIADALIGHYFADPSLANHNMKTIEFFTKDLLLKKDAAVIRYFYNMALCSDRNKKSFLSAEEVRKYLIDLYKLDNQEEWEKIRDQGTIWHIYIMERNYQLAGLLLDCFDLDHHKEELVRFFKMRALLSVECLLEDSLIRNERFEVLVSNISFAAMFFGASDTEEMFKMLLRLYTVEEIKAEFIEGNGWSPIHFAAMNANGDFIEKMYSMTATIPIKTNMRNPFGQTAVHLVGYSFAWKYVLELEGNIGAQRRQLADLYAGEKVIKFMHSCLEILVKKGGEDVNSCEAVTGQTVLHMAIKAGDLCTADLLLKLGANPAICDVRKRNCVYYAAKYGHMRLIIRLFSRCGAASLFSKDEGGSCALSAWKEEGQYTHIEENGPLSIGEMRFFATCYYVMEQMKEDPLK